MDFKEYYFWRTEQMINLEEAQIIEKEVIKKTEANLKAISKISKYYKDIVDYLEKAGYMSENFLVLRREQKKYENKFNKVKREYEEYKRDKDRLAETG